MRYQLVDPWSRFQDDWSIKIGLSEDILWHSSLDFVEHHDLWPVSAHFSLESHCASTINHHLSPSITADELVGPAEFSSAF